MAVERMTRDELQALVEERQGPCVSIYMPAHQAAGTAKEDPIRLKNLLREAERRLVEGGLRTSQARELLRDPRKLVSDSPFFRRLGDGLALFASAERTRWYSLPLPFDALVVVGDRFHVKPLLPLFAGDGRFYVLALSKNEVRLLEATRHNAVEVDVPEAPGNIGEALRYDESERSLQFRTFAGRPGGRRPAAYHGQGAGADDAKEDLRRYFRRVDRGVRDALSDDRAPVVLAGVDYLLPVYREASALSDLATRWIAGNPEELSARELHRRAWKIVEPAFLQAQEKAAARFAELAGTGKASGDVKTIVPAAYRGRVDALFVAVGGHRFGSFDAESGNVRLRRKGAATDDLLDFAAIHTFLNGGTVYAVKPGSVPGRSSIAAVFRY